MKIRHPMTLRHPVSIVWRDTSLWSCNVTRSYDWYHVTWLVRMLLSVVFVSLPRFLLLHFFVQCVYSISTQMVLSSCHIYSMIVMSQALMCACATCFIHMCDTNVCMCIYTCKRTLKVMTCICIYLFSCIYIYVYVCIYICNFMHIYI